MVKKLAALLFWVVGIGVFGNARVVWAANGLQTCKDNSSCVVGEFLFDDSYVPINIGATCTLSSRDSNDNVFVNLGTMSPSGKNDGWYSYTLNVGQTEGVYPTQMCCTVPAGVGTTQYMCLDKSFTVAPAALGSTEVANAVWDAQSVGHTATGSFGKNLQNPTLTLADIWTYSSRTLSVGSSLAKEIWDYTETSTNNFANLVAKIWGSNTASNLASKSDVVGVATSLGTIEGKIDTLDVKVSSIGSTVGTILNKWGSYSAGDILSSVNNVTLGLGKSGDSCSVNSVFGNIACVKEKWGSQTAQGLYDVANSTLSVGNSLRAELSYNGKTTNAYDDLQTIKSYVDSLNTSMTTVGNNVAEVKTTVTSIETKVDSLNTKVDSVGTNVGTLLTKWGTYTVGEVLGAVNGVGSSLGTGSDTCASNTVFGNIACVKEKWGSQTAETLYTAANGAFTTISSLENELGYNGKSATAYSDLKTVKDNLDSLEASIGNSGDLSSAATLFGKIKGNQEDIAGVQTSIDSISNKVDLLSSGITTLNVGVSSLIDKWGTYTVADVINNIGSINSSIGVSGDACGSKATIFGGIACLQNNSGTGDTTLLTTVNNTASLITELTNELSYNGKSTHAYNDVQDIKTNVGLMLAAMGNNTDDANTATVFGRIKKIQSTVEALDTVGGQATAVIDKWGSLSASDIYDKVKDLSSQISAINTVTNVSSILTVSQASANDLQTLKNQILAMEALINVNKTLLEKTTEQPIIKTWLEDGSIIFKTMITNPASVQQTVPLKFYLPKEADKKNIIKIDPGLDVIYDSSEGAYYVSGEFDLKSNETKVIAIEVEDVWKIDQSQLDSLKMQAEDLSAPLKNTAYFAQGVTLKSDILVQLDSIARMQKEAVTPDSRIKAYRDNMDQLNKVQTEIGGLKGLVTSASSNNSLMGFVGGSQAISLWGVVVVLIVGIAFLTIYMRMAITRLNKNDRKRSSPKVSFHPNHQALRLAALMIVTMVPTFALTWVVLDKVAGSKPTKNYTAVATIIPTTVPQATPTEKPEETVLGTAVEKIKIAVPDGSVSIKVRILPDANSTILARIWAARTVDKYSEKDEWIEIGTNLDINGKNQLVRGWVRKVCELKNDNARKN
jgi:hypothetical protein